MAQTVIRGTQILNNTVQRQDLDTSTVGQAVVTKIVQGSGITLSSTGADSGTGDVTVTSPDVVSTDAGNIATLGTDNHILVPQSLIWSVRLRSFNAIGNPTFEVDQRNAGNALTNPANGIFTQDRWAVTKTALTGTVNTALQDASTAPIVIPGTNFGITAKFQRFTVGTAQASLAAGDYWFLTQVIEGPQWRELASDVHSLSLLVRSSLTSLAFSVSLRDATASHSLVKQCTLGASNQWSLVQLGNLPVWSGSFSAAPGQAGYQLAIVLAAGSTFTAAASSAWQAASVLGVTGMSNFLATAGATFDIAFIQHEPGSQCTTPMDCPFTQNLDDCLRYYQKSYDYGTAPGVATTNGAWSCSAAAAAHAINPLPFQKRMAKVPTFAMRSTATGATYNAIRDNNAAVDRTVTGTVNLGETGCGGVFIGTTNAAQTYYYGQWVADTGW